LRLLSLSFGWPSPEQKKTAQEQCQHHPVVIHLIPV